MTKSRDEQQQIARRIHALQDEAGRLRNQYTMDDPQFYALRMAWEALRVAWYVVNQGDDGGKLESLEGEIRTLKQTLGYSEVDEST